MDEEFVPWPAEVARDYRAAGYWTGEVLGALPTTEPDRTALVTPHRSMTFGELDLAADRTAAGLLERGLRPGDTVVVQLPNDIELVVLCLALFRARVRPVLALPAHRALELRHLIATSDAVAYFCQDRVLGFDYRDLASDLLSDLDCLTEVIVAGDPGVHTGLSEVDAEPVELAKPDAGAVALFLLSGGTTGAPKLIPRTHADYVYQLRESARLCEIGPDSRYLAVLPAEHNFALGCPGVLGVLRAGGTAVLAPAPTPDVCFDLIERAGVTVTSLVPPLVPLWLDEAHWTQADLSSLRLLQVGGARLDPAVAADVRPRLGCVLQQVYGMAEGLLNFTRLDDPEHVILTTQGRPLSPADELRVVDADGADAAPGEPGELLTRGPYTLRGYSRAGEHNRTRFTADGFFRTGDLVLRLPSGDLRVVGRLNDVVNRGGEKVPAQEVESLLTELPGIAAAAVVGLPDPILGERTCACVRAADPADPPTLRAVRTALTARGLAAYKLPDELVVVADLPVTAVGKVDKKGLLAQLCPDNAVTHFERSPA